MKYLHGIEAKYDLNRVERYSTNEKHKHCPLAITETGCIVNGPIDYLHIVFLVNRRQNHEKIANHLRLNSEKHVTSIEKEYNRTN